MKTTVLKRVRKTFELDYLPRHTVRHNMRAWVRSIRFLHTESKRPWLLAVPVPRKDPE